MSRPPRTDTVRGPRPFPPARKSFGQHFLSDPSILGRLADALALADSDVVLEIGAGRGSLTRELARRAGRVVAVEADRALAAGLREEFGGTNVVVVEGDALKLDWGALLGSGCAQAPGRPALDAPPPPAPVPPYKLAGNIPYRLTSPLIAKALDSPRPAATVFLVQREVASRLAARPGEPAYGALTVGVRLVASVERLFRVPSGAFRPRPRVESAAVRLIPLARPLVADPAEQAAVRAVVRALFQRRRQQLRRILRAEWKVDEGQARELARGIGALPETRPGELAPERYVALTRALRLVRGMPSLIPPLLKPADLSD